MSALLALQTSMFSTARWNCRDTCQLVLLTLLTQPETSCTSHLDTIRGESGATSGRWARRPPSLIGGSSQREPHRRPRLEASSRTQPTDHPTCTYLRFPMSFVPATRKTAPVAQKEHRSRCLPEGLGSSRGGFSLVGQCCRDCVVGRSAKELVSMRANPLRLGRN
jgi:hypothetical protein